MITNGAAAVKSGVNRLKRQIFWEIFTNIILLYYSNHYFAIR
jgi:hypothetical protein